jgi:hypothetical protein
MEFVKDKSESLKAAIEVLRQKILSNIFFVKRRHEELKSESETILNMTYTNKRVHIS